MKYNPQIHHRRSIRLQDYDYSSEGAYFVTICARHRECLFGEIVNGEIVLNEYGKIAEQCWNDMPNHYDNIALDAFIIMPNHFHGIIFITDNVDNVRAIHELPLHELPLRELPLHESLLHESPLYELSLHESSLHELPLRKSSIQSPLQRRKMLLPKIIGRFKMNAAKQINQIRNTPGLPVWQRNYYEHIIRNEESLNNIRNYIVNNPSKWYDDEYNPKMDKK